MDVHNRKQKGIAAVEMLFVLPILLILMVGIFEISRIFIQYTTLNKAVQAGARYALLDIYGAQPQGTIAPESQIKNVVVYGMRGSGTESQKVLTGISTANISIDTSSSEHITVSAVYPYSPVFSKIPFTNTSLSMNLSASASMRRSGI
ncbi:TadE/TadG family type IV pilus assembly protein [Vibrio gallicus]|uniref:TadE/TadG family type IV pilus assembly protein n=1 Tax=Vibrio gallicus TaxID=190897 RepID=UPI0021C3E73C|nr:TadE/TadG family type IV pilus assembly protein [Vibrio gallicus]